MAQNLTSSRHAGWLLLVSLLSLLEGAFSFGKYLQAHQEQQQLKRLSAEATSSDEVVGASLNLTSDSHEDDSGLDFQVKDRSAMLRRNDGGETESAIKGGDDGDRGGEAQIETMAAILIAAIFGVFIVIYTIFLQCCWRCRNRRRHKSLDYANCCDDTVTAAAVAAAAAAASSPDGGQECSCFAAHTMMWEPVDLEKCLAQLEHEGTTTTKAMKTSKVTS